MQPTPPAHPPPGRGGPQPTPPTGAPPPGAVRGGAPGGLSHPGVSSSTSGVSQSAAEPRAEALTFKVMRLNRPNFWTAAPSSGLSLLLDDSCMTTVGNSSTLCFPAGFGNIYLGETFQAYISACNNGAQHLTRLEVRAEIQTGTKRLPLLDGQAANSLLPSFAPRQCADFVVSHELKEAGVHIMICSGSYLEPSGEEKKVRQYFKFQVQKPLSVTTKLHFLNNTILLENQIQNMTKAALSLGVIKFEPTAHYSRQDLTIADPEHEPGDAKDVPLFGAETVVRPGDVRQFVFRLVPRSGILNASDKASFDLGRLEMAWQTCLGEPGRLHSLVNMQQWKLPAAQEVVVTAECEDDRIQVDKPFCVQVKVLNNKTEPLELQFHLDLDLNGPIVHCSGATAKAVGVVAAGASHTVRAHLVAMQQGLWQISPAQVVVEEVARVDDAAARSRSSSKYPLSHTLHLLAEPADLT